MRFIKILSISALVLGAPVFTDPIGLSDSASVHAKGNGGGNGGGRGGGGGGGKGGGADRGGDKGGEKGNGGRSAGKGKGGGKDNGAKSAGKGGKGADKAKAGGNRSAGVRGNGRTLRDILGINKAKKGQAGKTQRSWNNKSQQTASRAAPAKPAKRAAKPVRASAPQVEKSLRPPALPTTRPKPVQAQLKGLNSLNRNINGLMNSNDPKMDGFRAFVASSAALVTAEAALEDAQNNFGATLDAYNALLDELGYEQPTTAEEFDALRATLTEQANATEPMAEDFTGADGVLDEDAFNAAVDQWSADTVAANAALDDLDAASEAFNAIDDAEMAVAEGLEATSDEALTQAIVDGLNATGAGPVTEDDVTDEMFDWVSGRLGVGDEQDGLIDDFIAQQEEAALDDEMVEDDVEDAVIVEDS